jgi:hypothetical protein
VRRQDAERFIEEVCGDDPESRELPADRGARARGEVELGGSSSACLSRNARLIVSHGVWEANDRAETSIARARPVGELSTLRLLRAAVLFASLGALIVASRDSSEANARALPSHQQQKLVRCGWRSVASPGDLREWAAVDASSARNVWAVGGYYNPNVAHWDGGQWSLAKPSKADAYYDVRVFGDNDVWLVGDSGVGPVAAHWNGSRWKRTPIPQAAMTDESYIDAIDGVLPDDLWAVGALGANRAALTMHWDGRAWKIFGNPATGDGNNVLYDVAVTNKGSAWAVGHQAGTKVVLRWDGVRWSRVRSAGLDSANFSAVAATSENDVWVVGDLHELAHGGFAAHWNGRTWRSVRSAYFKAGSALTDVTAASPRDAWAVGATDSGLDGSALVEHWNGARWAATVLDTPPNAVLNGVTQIAPSDVWVVGSTDYEYRSLIEHYTC